MSKKYTDAMDKIIASDELKAKVLAAANEKIVSADKSHIKNARRTFIKRAVSYAACFAVCITSVILYKNFRAENDNTLEPVAPVHTKAPAPTITPDITDTPAPKKVPSETAAPQKDVKVKPSGTIPENTAKPAPTPVADIPAVTPAPTVSAGAPSNGDEPETDTPPKGVCGGNPFADADSIAELYESAGYNFMLPSVLPDGYTQSSCALIDGTLIQILYSCGENTILYRTEKTDGDISGDYNSYPNTDLMDIGNLSVTARGFGGKYYSITWIDGENAYSLGSSDGLSVDDIKKIIIGMDFYKSENAQTN